MSIPGVNSEKPGAVYDSTNKYGKTKTEKAAADEAKAAEQLDTYEKGDSGEATAGIYKRDTAKLAQLNAGQKAYIQNLQNLVSELVNQTGKDGVSKGHGKFNASQGGINPNKVESYWDLLVDNGDGTFSLDPSLSAEDQEKIISKAQEDIGENGYYGVKQTSQRILDYAKAITGGDPSKIEDMRKMAQEAFDSVKEMMGGQLPEISQQTYDAVMKGFDEWAAGAAAK